MPRRRPLVAFEIEPDMKVGLDTVKERDGVPLSEQIRRAIRMWLESKGIEGKAERKRAATRPRS